MNVKLALHAKPTVDKGLVVYATDEGWCCKSDPHSIEAEVLCEFPNLKTMLADAGYNEYGDVIDGESVSPANTGTQTAQVDVTAPTGDTETDEPQIETPSNDPEPQTVESGDAEPEVEPESDVEPEPEPEVSEDSGELNFDEITYEFLKGKRIDELRKIGAEFDVSDRSKEKLIKKILDAKEELGL